MEPGVFRVFLHGPHKRVDLRIDQRVHRNKALLYQGLCGRVPFGNLRDLVAHLFLTDFEFVEPAIYANQVHADFVLPDLQRIQLGVMSIELGGVGVQRLRVPGRKGRGRACRAREFRQALRLRG